MTAFTKRRWVAFAIVLAGFFLRYTSSEIVGDRTVKSSGMTKRRKLTVFVTDTTFEDVEDFEIETVVEGPRYAL